MERRRFLQGALGLSGAVVLSNAGRFAATATAANVDGTKWRAFEVVTRVEIVNPWVSPESGCRFHS